MINAVLDGNSDAKTFRFARTAGGGGVGSLRKFPAEIRRTTTVREAAD
jgi:hypothetical protein